ncbi:TPA: hypothetical protein RR046_004006 [Klebsiella pneumoniae]|nr:hypothetical protein [Klebsiella pneumoniae]HBR5288515.1 hypothetical protein [Klebsiella pneumoniae]HBS6659262.1 hypothetical protein [Klebsiella pneumoniae]HBS6946297.1 hypothetical protein [Klebsiella pneumoniae]HBS7324986.1 hypothetical protein [Klebsiella pneumoniae]
MKSSYISYFEGYDAEGYLIYSGNGAATVEHGDGECIDPSELKDQHCDFLLKKARETNNLISRIVIKNLMKL